MKNSLLEWVQRTIRDFLETSPSNNLGNAASDRAWDQALVGISSGADPLYERYKDLVGPFHFTPAELFNMHFPDNPAESEQLSVISWSLPQREITKAANRQEVFFQSELWQRARLAGEDCNAALRAHMVEKLTQEGIDSLAPQLSQFWDRKYSKRWGVASRWSERHAAFAAGLGTFGLCDALITPKGKAHRVGSVIARTEAQPTTRPYGEDHHAYCLYYADGSCMACAKRCPVGALSEQGHDKKICWDHAGGTCREHAKEKWGLDGYGCGLCQTKVPCESGIPAKLAKKFGLAAAG